MGKLVATLLVLCLMPLTTCSLRHDLRRGLEQAMHGGRRLADSTAGDGVVVPIYWSNGVYMVNYTIGTPPQPASAIVDVGGELVWTQCSLCQRCFKQDLPLFVPNASSTFRPEPCGTDACKSSSPTSNCSNNVCTYDGSTKLGARTSGIVGTDTFAIGTATASLAFGCVVASDVVDSMGGSSGFVGLGRTPSSLVAQMKLARFSYCLAPHDAGKNSRLFLGASAKLAGGNSTTVPFVRTTPGDTLCQYYPVQLEGIKAGDAAIALPPGSSTVMVQTFAPMSFLVDSAYQDLKKAVTKAVGAAPTSTPVEPFDLCFPKAGVSSSAPSIVFTFHGAAALTVEQSRYLIEADKDTLCLAILSTSWLNSTALDKTNILGSLQQVNIHFLFDLDKETVSFQPADCSSLS
ncbi:aspartic proteinase nepenthesin-1-like [Oryza brachyantha]|uniref:aspartic proteinase nepenthesin-1-like n=1 Tax=Oryza brachyantha TaxID=4533 RepID=UPI0003EA87EF|nr:aspartic proteinase nepenthesin-1-like [Oryza brachyantha]